MKRKKNLNLDVAQDETAFRLHEKAQDLSDKGER